MQSGKILRQRYKIIQSLGSGGFGDTYLAEDLDLPGKPKCVVKHLKPKISFLLHRLSKLLIQRLLQRHRWPKAQSHILIPRDHISGFRIPKRPLTTIPQRKLPKP